MASAPTLEAIDALAGTVARLQLALSQRTDAPSVTARTYTAMADWEIDLARSEPKAAAGAIARAQKHLTLASLMVD